MKLSCSVDGKNLSLSVNSQKSLLGILVDDCDISYLKNKSQKGIDNNCLVYMDDFIVISSLVPSFALKNSKIITFEGFKTDNVYYNMIKKIYDSSNIVPCPHCYESRTLIINSLANKYKNSIVFTTNDDQYIKKELSLVDCKCLDPSELTMLVKAVSMEFKKHEEEKISKSKGKKR